MHPAASAFRVVRSSRVAKHLRFLTFACLWLVPALGMLTVPAARAAEAVALYEAQVPVQGQGTAERGDALRRALAEVLVKLSGDRATPKSAALTRLLKDAPRFVLEYRYQAPAEGQASPGGQQLWVLFDGEAVEQEMRKAGIPVWGRTRPSTLVWLAVDDGGGRRFLIADGARAAAATELRTAAQRRGVPLLLPLMDLEDQDRLRPDDVWNGSRETVLSASARYRPEAILAGRMREERPGVWVVRWTFYQQTAASEWTTRGAEAEAVAGGIDRTADALAARLVVPAAGGTQPLGLMLKVFDVRSVEGYARTLRYLTGLSSVSQVRVTRVEDSTITFMLEVRGDPHVLERAIALGNILAMAPAMPVGAATPGGLAPGEAQEGSTVLAYRLLP